MPETLVTSPEYKHRIEEKSPLGEKFKGNDFLKEDVKEKDKDCAWKQRAVHWVKTCVLLHFLFQGNSDHTKEVLDRMNFA